MPDDGGDFVTENEPIEMAVRCYVEPATGTDRPNMRTGYQRVPVTGENTDTEPSPNRVLVLDTETTIDRFQNLTFGSFRTYQNGVLQYEGIFMGENLPEQDLRTLQDYGKSNKIQVCSVREFVDDIFLPEIYNAHTLCVGFNLPFDLSRLAISYGDARGRNKGGFSFQLSPNPRYPRLVITHRNSKTAFIQFTSGFSDVRGNFRNKRGNPNTFRGNFLDLRSFTFALTNESHSLESACKLFKAETGKVHPEEHGKITPEYIDYNRNDVEATYSLFVRLSKEFEKYNLDEMPTKLYSPASIGKAYFRAMGIKPFNEKNPEFPKEFLGNLMVGYYGGRSEVRVRKTPMEVALIDFLSMYPTMCIIQNLWQFVIADKVDWVDDTENVRKFVDGTTIHDLSNPDTWKKLTVLVQVQPDEDILPVRSKYGDKLTFNIGLNYLTSKDTCWYVLSDVLASKLLTGKTPIPRRQ